MKWEAVFFDFDGVISDSVNVKTQAFAQMFRPYGRDIEEAVVRYHLQNGGVSRYEKFRYYYEELLKKSVSDSDLNELGQEFSNLVVQKVIDSPYIPGALETIKHLHNQSIPAFVVSGTPDEEIKLIVQKKCLYKYFAEVHGSPRKKWDITAEIMNRWSFEPNSCLFLGDADSDYKAAQYNNVHFLGIVPENESSRFPEGTKISTVVDISSLDIGT